MSDLLSPLDVLAAWRDEARASGTAEPEAMVLTTVGLNGAPSARVVLWRGSDPEALHFFTSYESRKGAELEHNPQAAAVFFWPSIGKQVRVEGRAEKLSAAQSDAYFAQRPRGHQLQAWASAQSRRIESLDEVRAARAEVERRHAGQPIPRPPYWGGYRLVADYVELWSAGPDRLHERRAFERRLGAWVEHRLSP